MSDFADGIAPQRYPCRRPAACCRWSPSTSDQNRRGISGTNIDASTHWSLDEGRWKGSFGSSRDTVAAYGWPRSEQNVFIAFKRFVDRKWDDLTQTITNRAKVEDQGRKIDDATSRRTSQMPDLMPPPATTAPPSVGAREATRRMLRQAEFLTLDVPTRSIQELFREDGADDAPRRHSTAEALLAFGGACYFLPEIGDSLPSSASLFRPIPRPPRWLSINWFQESPYSPLQLESDDNLPGSRERWRAAFTDLMAAALDRPLPPQTFEHPSLRVQLQPGIDWVFGLQINGILPSLLPHLQSERSRSISSLASRHSQRDFDKLVREVEKSDRASFILRRCEAALQFGTAASISTSAASPRGIDSRDNTADTLPRLAKVHTQPKSNLDRSRLEV